MLTLDSVLTIAPGVVARESDDELVVVLPEGGKFFVLNGTGAEIFQMVDGAHTLSDIAAALQSHYEEVERARVESDVLAFAEKILEKAAVRIVE
jgi:hypothetical protein